MNKGVVTQIIGPVVDISFKEGQLPALYNAIEIEKAGENGQKEKIILEVAQHLGDNAVRTISMHPTDGLVRGMDALDTALWTYREDSFLPHGRDSEAGAAEEPVLLTTETANPNGSQVLFVVDRAATDALSGYERIVYMFDGRDDEALSEARGFWKEAKEAGHPLTYWQQDGGGRWQKKA